MDTDDTILPAPWLDTSLAASLLSEHGSPLHVYREETLRLRLRELAGLLTHRPWHPSISVKANGNPHLLAVARSEGLSGDAMSPGEILLLEAAGFAPEEVFFIPNNVDLAELRFAATRGILTSLDSLDQVRLFARHRVASRVALRLNPGTGDGHHEKVVTAGARTKFGLLREELPEAIGILTGSGIALVGLNQHIGSGFLEPSRYLQAAAFLLETAKGIPSLAFVDFGGGFGVPYRGEDRLDLVRLGRELDAMLADWCRRTGRTIGARIEPGRYWCAESGCVLGTVHAVKTRGEGVIAGTDIGFNALQRPVLYDAWHGIDLLTGGEGDRLTETVTWVGNICESGDILARDRIGPAPRAGDRVLVRDTGAYGWSMSSSYNARPRLAELLLRADGSVQVIRQRGSVDDLLKGVPAVPSGNASLPEGSPGLEVLLPALRGLVEATCRDPGSRMGNDFFRQHVLVVEGFCRQLAPLFGADLDIVLPAAILHDIAAIEDFSRVAEHHTLGAVRIAEILREHGFGAERIGRIAACAQLHLVPVPPEEHGPEAACLSHADALSQMARPAYWLHYAGKVRGLGFEEGREWYRSLVEDRFSRLTDSVMPLATALRCKALEACGTAGREEEEIPCS